MEKTSFIVRNVAYFKLDMYLQMLIHIHVLI